MKAHLEIEAKYDLSEDQQVPDLTRVGGVETVVVLEPMVLTATYYDTAEQALLTGGVTMRRRTGGTDDGWHLKVPVSGGERLEVSRPLGRGDAPPAAITTLVRGLVRSGELQPVATLVNNRTVHHLKSRDGRVLAELADDRVTGERLGVDGSTIIWREMEVELVEADRDVLAALDAAVLAAGISHASGSSKVGRVLGEKSAPVPAPPKAGRRRKVRDVIAPRAALAVTELQSVDPLLRLGRPGSAAKARIALHRLRAVLALQGQVSAFAASAQLRVDLEWLERLVVDVEGIESAQAHIRSVLADQPRQLVLGPVGRRIDRESVAARKSSLAGLQAALDSPRYLDLMDSLHDATSTAYDGEAWTKRATAVLPPLADRATRRAERRLAQLRRAQSDDERRRDVRGTLRSVVRAHVAHELVSSDAGAEPTRLDLALSNAAARISDLDVSLRSQGALREAAVQANLAGENAFTHGRLHGLEQARSAELVAELAQARKDVRRSRRH